MRDQLIQGVGLSARPFYFEDLVQESSSISWLEIVPDNILMSSCFLKKKVETLSERYPIVFHCLELSIGSTHPFDPTYLHKTRDLQKKLKPAWISDHWCWTSQEDHYFHDLLPLPYTEETAKHLIKRIGFLQDFFEDVLVFENISSYFSYKMSDMEESDFFKYVMESSGCQFLLDINNLYVNSVNRGFKNPEDFFYQIPKKFIKQIHLAGFTRKGHYLIDTHSRPISEEVWLLYKKALKYYGAIPTCIEWDDDLPSYKTLIKEIERTKEYLNNHSKKPLTSEVSKISKTTTATTTTTITTKHF